MCENENIPYSCNTEVNVLFKLLSAIVPNGSQMSCSSSLVQCYNENYAECCEDLTEILREKNRFCGPLQAMLHGRLWKLQHFNVDSVR